MGFNAQIKNETVKFEEGILDLIWAFPSNYFNAVASSETKKTYISSIHCEDLSEKKHTFPGCQCESKIKMIFDLNHTVSPMQRN